MRFDMPMARRVAILAAVSLALAAGATAGDKKGQARHNASETVDSSSLGVLLEGQRVATETFTLELQASTSTIKSQLQEASAAHPASQESNLEITANGQLLRFGEIRAATCQPEGSSFQCQPERGDFGVGIPRDRSSR